MKILVEQVTEEITLKMFIYLNIETGGYATYCPVLLGSKVGETFPKINQRCAYQMAGSWKIRIGLALLASFVGPI